MKTVAEVHAGMLDGTITRERCCDEKQGYWTYSYAQKRKPELEARYKKRYEIYPCPYCHKWHMSTVR